MGNVLYVLFIFIYFYYAISRENLAHQGNIGNSPKLGKQIQDGGRPPSWKYIYRCISAISGPICTKFRLHIDIRHIRITVAQNYAFIKFKMATTYKTAEISLPCHKVLSLFRIDALAITTVTWCTLK